MSERSIPRNFRSELLGQDELFDSERYKEHRMQLELQLAQAESRERITRRVAIGALVVVASAFFVLASNGFRGADPFDKEATALTIAAGVAYTLGWVVFFVGLASYVSRFLPRVRRAREDLRDETIREMRQEIAELRQLLEGKLKADRKDSSGTEN